MLIVYLHLLFMSIDHGFADLTIKNEDETVAIIHHEDYRLPHIHSLFMNEKRLNQLLDHLEEVTFQEPIQAKIDEEGDIVEGVPGSALRREDMVRLLLKYFYEGNSQPIDIPKRAVYPRVTSELLAEIYDKKIATYQTRFQEEYEARAKNIGLSVAAINNQIIFPNDTFSFNDIVGERTVERGYMRAPVIIKGELSTDIGGGICQVSSTLFNAVNMNGIEMIERYSHSRSVPYVPPGKDAAVSWWGPDLVFRNKYNQPLLIRASSTSGQVIIDVYTAADVDYKRD